MNNIEAPNPNSTNYLTESSAPTNFIPVIDDDQNYVNLENHARSVSADESSVHRPLSNVNELIASSSDCGNEQNLSENVPTCVDDSFYHRENMGSSKNATDSDEKVFDVSANEIINNNNNANHVFLDSELPKTYNLSNASFETNILSVKNDPSISINCLSNSSSSFSSYSSFDKIDYGVNFSEDTSKITGNDGLVASDLITSEIMGDFFDEMCDMNCTDPCRSLKDNINNSHLAQNRFYAEEIDGKANEKDWNVSAGQFKICGHPIVKRDNVAFKSSLKRPNDVDFSKDYQPCKKSKKGITFDSVSVYYFPRTQGFTCIPSQGGSTLGMSWNHSHIRKFSLGEHATEQRRAHRQHSSQEPLDASHNWNELSNVSSEDSDSDEIISDSEMDHENYNFLQPIPTRERRAILRASGVQKIDSREKDECRSIRLSREFCGCTCQIYCDPERCLCAQAGIKCQVDRMNFPCSCTRESCANENGRVEFNPVRVQMHYIHTVTRLQMEQKKEEDDERNHRLLLTNLENASQLGSYVTSVPQPSSSSSALTVGDHGAANVLSTFSYHSEPLSYYSQSPPPLPQQQLRTLSYDLPLSTSAKPIGNPADSCQLPLPAFSYATRHPYALDNVAVNQSVSPYGPLSTACSLAPLDATEDVGSSTQSAGEFHLAAIGAEYAADANNTAVGAEILPQPDFEEAPAAAVAVAVTATAASETPPPAYDSDFLLRLSDGCSKESSFECQSEGENLDTSAEVSEETEKEEDEDTENFGDLIKKTMVESVIA